MAEQDHIHLCLFRPVLQAHEGAFYPIEMAVRLIDAKISPRGGTLDGHILGRITIALDQKHTGKRLAFMIGTKITAVKDLLHTFVAGNGLFY
ncbi:hypothetical protein MXD63_40815, partial [Frankia sp. Cpl3]|nr:hypothetical protein [Frankia sp. Cpl3]